jgi:two-component system chemotaxis sensor kinase CheA
VSDLARYRSTYFAECADRIAEAERALDRLRVDASDLDVLDAAFRAVHSVKGGAGMFGFAEVVAFAHDFETLLDRLRDGRVAPEPHVAALCLRALDALADLVAAARARADEADAPPRRALVSFAPSRAFCESDDALLLLRELARLGPTHVEARIAPDTLEAFDPARPTLAWTVEIETTAPLDAVRAIFEFAAVDCALDVAEAEAPPPDVALRSAAAAVDRTAPAAAAPSVRVPLDRLDAVVDVLGDILVAQACLEQTIAGLGRRDDAALALGLETLNRHARALRESVMAMRAQPVGVVFARLPRLVRELAAQLGKKVRLESEGEAVEIDLTVVEHLADPLTHMIRNALDHGIETPDRRRAAGKLEEGRVRVAARQAGDRILVEVSDDGAGIDRARVRAKAVEKGLVAPDAQLTEEALDELVLAPGFSTADAVTDLSGRGVGLDVVRANVERLGGRVSLRGDPGRGLVVRLALPLTLAVLDAMLVEASGST